MIKDSATQSSRYVFCPCGCGRRISEDEAKDMIDNHMTHTSVRGYFSDAGESND